MGREPKNKLNNVFLNFCWHPKCAFRSTLKNHKKETKSETKIKKNLVSTFLKIPPWIFQSPKTRISGTLDCSLHVQFILFPKFCLPLRPFKALYVYEEIKISKNCKIIDIKNSIVTQKIDLKIFSFISLVKGGCK